MRKGLKCGVATQETRRENQQRIWDEVQRRKAAGTLGKGGAQAISESASFAEMVRGVPLSPEAPAHTRPPASGRAPKLPH